MSCARASAHGRCANSLAFERASNGRGVSLEGFADVDVRVCEFLKKRRLGSSFCARLRHPDCAHGQLASLIGFVAGFDGKPRSEKVGEAAGAKLRRIIPGQLVSPMSFGREAVHATTVFRHFLPRMALCDVGDGSSWSGASSCQAAVGRSIVSERCFSPQCPQREVA